jgi:streptogramin lyase
MISKSMPSGFDPMDGTGFQKDNVETNGDDDSKIKSSRPSRMLAARTRISSSGEVAQFALDSAIARLGRVAVAPDGAVWFADATGAGITQLKDGAFTRHELGSAGSGPYGVAVTADGIVWATLQTGSKLIRIEPNGAMATIDLSQPGAVPTDLAVGTDGPVWFLQFRANRIGRLSNGELSDFKVAEQNAGLSGLAVAGDGAVWFRPRPQSPWVHRVGQHAVLDEARQRRRTTPP